MIYILLNSQNIVVDVIAYDGVSAYTPPSGLTLMQAPAGTEVGATYANGTFINPAVPTPTIDQQIAALEALQTPRLMREAATAATNVFPAGNSYAGLTSAQALAQIQTQIAALRSKMS